MEGLLTGILGLLTFVLFGILAGAGVGAVWDLAGALAIVGALSGAVGFVVRDRLRAGR
jgi:flagellar motor component MotA